MTESKQSEAEEAGEVHLTLDQVPPAPRAALVREAAGSPVKTVDKESDKHGQTIYETDVNLDGKNWEIKVDESGELVSKKLDNEDSEKGKKAKEDDGDERHEKK